MIVYCNSVFSDDLKEKNHFVSKFLGGLIYHFQDIEFEGVHEVVHLIVCGPESFLLSYGLGTSYGRRSRLLSSLFTISYEKVKELEGRLLLEYISGEFLSETDRFEKLKPKEFDLSAYKNSLAKYLNKSIEQVTNGGDPSANKVLREDIQQAMSKKFFRL